MTQVIPEHLKRHKWIYEQHNKGITYTQLAHQMKITPSRVRELYMRWERQLRSIQKDDALEIQYVICPKCGNVFDVAQNNSDNDVKV